jgi:hypothetical protein
MKKLVTLSCLFLMCFSVVLQAKNTVVSTKTQFTTAWGALADGDTISVAYNGGTILNIGEVKMTSAGGCITLMAQYPDSVPTLQIQISGIGLAEGVTCGLVCENLHLQYRSPTSSSGQIIYFKEMYANISQLVFRNCEISQSVRSLFRSTKPAASTSCGDVDYFEMTNCVVHNTFFAGHVYPIVYFGHLPVEVNFKNNTFYDMPYLKSIFTISYADPNQGRNATINFENNTVCLSGPTGGLIVTGAFLGEESQFNIKNNLLLVPNWENDRNLHDSLYSDPKIVSCKYGMITAENNLIEGYRNWKAGEVIDSTGAGEFVSLDTIPQYTMSGLGVSWADFTDPEAGDYSYLFNSPLATAGSDGGPIGDPRWVLTFNDPKYLTVSAGIEEAVVTPVKGVYENGSSVTVTASEVVGYHFKSWKDTLGNVVSTENPYTFSITSDASLVADYEALVARDVTVAISGSTTATYSISPVQAIYYEGDIVTITLDDHAINRFMGWSDNKQVMKRTDTIQGNLTLTATFEPFPYLLAWDFCQLTANNLKFSNLEANHYVDASNRGSMNHVGLDTLSATFETRNNKFSAGELHNCAVRRTPAANFDHPDYLFVKFSTKDQAYVKVVSSYGSDNCIYQVQKMQYSLNGTDYTDFDTDTLPATAEEAFNRWCYLEGALPAPALGQDSVFVRWIADPTSTRLFTASSLQTLEYFFLSKIIVLNQDYNSLTAPSQKTVSYFTSGGTLFIKSTSTKVATVYDIMGKKVLSTRLNEGVNQINGLPRGLYIVQLGTETIKVVI